MTWLVALVALGITAPACCCVPVPGPAGLAPWNSKELGVKAAPAWNWALQGGEEGLSAL